jgi:hypothetical protein
MKRVGRARGRGNMVPLNRASSHAWKGPERRSPRPPPCTMLAPRRRGRVVFVARLSAQRAISRAKSLTPRSGLSRSQMMLNAGAVCVVVSDLWLSPG